MSRRKNIPQCELEDAIVRKEQGKIIQLIVEGRELSGYEVLPLKAFSSLPISVAAVVIRCGMTRLLRNKTLDFLKQEHPHSAVIKLIKDVESVPLGRATEQDDELLEAITKQDETKIRRLICEKQINLMSATQERLQAFCLALQGLNPHTVVLLLQSGFHYASKPFLFMFLLNECEEAECLKSLNYKTRLKFANMLIHLLQGEITLEDNDFIEQDWFPMGNSIENGCDRQIYCHSYSYYFDPKHLYEPRFTDGEYEKPEHSLR